MKYYFYQLLLSLCSFQVVKAQYDFKLLNTWTSDIVAIDSFNNAYNEVWGFEKNGREFAVIGSGMGSHIIDVTDPTDLEEVAYIPGAFQGYYAIHRDYHDYNGYLYIVGDESAKVHGVMKKATLQIVDISDLPYSYEVVYDTNILFMQAHNIFIDTATAHLYACATKDVNFERKSLMKFSLANPASPEWMYTMDLQFNAHDVYVRNDTVYMNAETFGLVVYDFTGDEPEIIGQLLSYPDQGYNHSGWLNDAGDYYLMCDETQNSRLKMIHIDTSFNLEVVSVFNGPNFDTLSVYHNPLIKGDYAYVSSYFDGLVVYDINDPNNPTVVANYDSFDGEKIFGGFEGAWGVYPYLSSGNILLSDMTKGLLVLTKDSDTDINELFTGEGDYTFYPNPNNGSFNVSIKQNVKKVRITNLQGQIVYDKQHASNLFQINLNDQYAGIYLVEFTFNDNIKRIEKIVIHSQR